MPKTVWQTFSHGLSGSRAMALWLCVLVFIGNALGFVGPYFYKLIADYALAHSTTNFHWTELLFPIIGILSSLFGAELLFRAVHLLEIPVTLRAYSQTTSYIYELLLDRPSSFFEDRFSGELSRRVEQIGEGVKYFLSDFLWSAAWVMCGGLVSMGLLYIAHPLLCAYFFVWVVLFSLTSYPLLRWQFLVTKKLAESQADLAGKMVDSFANISVVHTFARIDREREHFNDELGNVLTAERRERRMFVVNKFQQGISIAVLGTFLLIGSLQLFSQGALSVGAFLIVASVIPSLAGVIWSAGDIILQTVRTYGKIADALRDLHTDVEKIPEGRVQLKVADASIDFERVAFSYPSTEEAVFENFSLHIRAGERVGLVGHSGAGKSTLVKLLLRQYDPRNGVISIGADDTKDVTLESLRNAIAFVPQDTSLFHRSLYENIAYAKAGATRDEVIAASTKAHAHEFIEATPQKYGTLVGERGIKLSGGQRQRIAIARAMLKNAPILVLDEATSALDSESEEIVQKGLHELFEGRTVIAIAHRLSTLREMDRIVVIENGKVVEDGSPKDLLTKETSVFKDLWEHQKGGFVE